MIPSINLTARRVFLLVLAAAATVQGQNLGDWVVCSTSSQCKNGCCSSKYSNDGKLKCTPLNGGFDANICVTSSSTGTLGDWTFCSTSSQCKNGCCSSKYSNDGKLKCTPLTGGFDANICVASGPAPGPAPAPAPGSGTVLYSGSGSGTYYYDVTGRTCNGDPSPYAENNGYPMCTSNDPAFWKTLVQYGTNKIVAIDRDLLKSDRAKYCGKQIQVFKNGVEVSGGPFVVFDGCEACIGGGKIDFSVSVLDVIDNGKACTTGNVPGISWKVLDNQVIPFKP